MIRFGNGVSVEVGEEADRETVRWLYGLISIMSHENGTGSEMK